MINIDTRIFNSKYGLNESDMWLLLHIVKRLDIDDSCFPSNERLQNETGWASQKLKTVKQSLIKRGIIEVTARFNDGRQTSNIYRIKTSFLSVFVTVDKLTKDGIGEGGENHLPRWKSPSPEGGENHPTEVLTIDEVLVHEESNDSSSKKPVLAKAKSETKTKKEGGGPVYVACVEHWLKVVHPGWGFKAVDGKAMKAIIAQMVQYSNMKQLKDGGSVKYPSDEQLINFFKHFCKSLPEFYKSQTLTVLNTKFDSIIETIKRSDGKGKQPVNWNNPKDTSAIIRNLR